MFHNGVKVCGGTPPRFGGIRFANASHGARPVALYLFWLLGSAVNMSTCSLHSLYVASKRPSMIQFADV